MAKLSFQDQQELIRILIGYGRLDLNLRRTNFFFMTGLQDEAPDLVSQIPIDGDTATFCQKVVPTANQYGLLSSGDPAILRVVQYMQGEVRGHPNLVQNLKAMEAKLQGQSLSPSGTSSTRQMKVVGLFANPKDMPHLNVEGEERVLREILGRYPYFDITTITRTRIKDLTATLDSKHPTIFHYSGHANQMGIMVESEDGIQAVVVPWIALARELDENPNLQCVLLNGCQSRQDSFIQGFNGKRPFIVAMKEPISDRIAIAFSERFYEAVAVGDSYDVAFRKGCNVLTMGGYCDVSDIPQLIRPQ